MENDGLLVTLTTVCGVMTAPVFERNKRKNLTYIRITNSMAQNRADNNISVNCTTGAIKADIMNQQKHTDSDEYFYL